MRKYYVVLELSDDDYEGKPHDIACWIEMGMNSYDANPDDISATVYDKLEEFLSDTVLDSLAATEVDHEPV